MNNPVARPSVSRTPRSCNAVIASVSLALLLVAAAPSAVAAQSDTERYSLAARVGIATAGGAFGAYTRPGTSAALRFAFALRPGTSWFVDGGLDAFKDKELKHQIVTGPSIDAVHLLTGAEHELVPEDLPGYENISLRVRAGIGIEKLDSDTFRFVDGTEDMTFSSTAFMAGAGLSVGYDVSPAVTLFFDAGMNWARVDEAKTEELANLAVFYVSTFGSAFSFPYGVGVRIGF